MSIGRRGKRLPVSLALDYRSFDPDPGQGVSGRGRTIDISTTGILFTANHELPLGHPVELSITWPILRYQSVPVTLVVVGEVIRTEAGAAAIKVSRREFLADPMLSLGARADSTAEWVM